jgi:pyruvate kinase
MNKKAKIIATIGPACRDASSMERMIDGGMDVARLNASHAKAEEISTDVRLLREAASRRGREVGILLDLMGPKIRVGEIKGDIVSLVEGQEYTLTSADILGDASRASLTNTRIPSLLEAGDTVLLDDGTIRLEVIESNDIEARCKIEEGGELKSHKGVNLPGKRLDLPSLTDKDRADIELGLELGVDWLALSFVRSKDNVADLRAFLRDKGSDIPVMAKIEKPEAVSEIEAIVDESDAIMVARGDLGVEMPLEEIPMLQKKIINVAVRYGKPAVTATQMLESMIHNVSPTRAEVTDVANAVFDGSDAVMLSGETAVGSYPLQAVTMMRRVIERAEDMLPYGRWLEERRKWVGEGMVEAVCFAACELALQTRSQAIVAPTESGFTARQVSRFRPRQSILAPTPSKDVARRLSLFWGIFPRELGVHGTAEEMFDAAGKVAAREGLLPPGGVVVIIVGMKDAEEEGMPITNTIRCVVGR